MLQNVIARCEPLEDRRLFAGLDWSTFVGGSSGDGIADVAAVPDGSGDVVVVGSSGSADFPATGGGPRPPDATAFVARVSGDGARLVYATFVPGNLQLQRVAVGPDGSPIAVGTTSDDAFAATPGAYRTPARDSDVVVVKLDPTGDGVTFVSRFGGTYSGGTTSDDVTGVAVDATGGIVLAGYTSSRDFPTTAGAFDRSINQRVVDGQAEPSTDAYVARLSPDGSRLAYSTFLGGQGDDEATAVAVDARGFVTVVGETNPWDESEEPDGQSVFTGTPFPTTADAFQRKYQSQEDGFVARLKLDGAGAADMRYGTILGSIGEDVAQGVAFDPADTNKVVVSGRTDGWNYPTTRGVFQRTRLPDDGSGDPDLTVAAFRFTDASGGTLQWSTLHGAIDGYQYESDVDVDGAGNVVVTGAVQISQFGDYERPTTQGAFDRTPGTAGAFLTRLSGDGTRLLYETNVDQAAIGGVPRLAAVGRDSVVIAGSTFGELFPTTSGSLDPVLNDGSPQSNVPSDGYVARFTFGPIDPSDTTAAAPALLAPAAGARFPASHETGQGSTVVTFDWTDVADPSGVQLYELEVGHNADFAVRSETDDSRRLLIRATDSQAETGFDFGDAVLYWRVRTIDNANNASAWSEARRFELGTLAEPRLAAVEIAPTGVPGGTAAQGKVLLEGFAPAGGTRVRLVSSDPDLATVPATVTVPAGANSATFPINTKAVAVSKYVWIEAQLGEDSAAPVLWIDPAGTTASPKLKSLTFRPGSVTGGQKSIATLTLESPAPAGGLRVALASDDTDVARVPGSVVVAAGETSVTFEVTTRPVSSTRQVEITATTADSDRDARLTVRPAAAKKYQAESATRRGAVAADDHRGYWGRGFVDFVNARNDYVEFEVNAATAGTYTLKFRYANGSKSARSMGLKVNGVSRSGGVTFGPTGSWSTWREKSVEVRLAAGTNRIRLTATGQSGPNLDALTVVG